MGGFRLYSLLAAAVLACGVAAMLPMALTGADALESSYREYAVRDMTANANLFALSVSAQPDDVDLTRLARVARIGSETRFTVIAGDGAVIADSGEEAGRMENHAGRPEVREALAGETGVNIRKSPTLGTEWIYVAIPFGDGKVIRAAASLDDLNLRLSQWWRRAWVGCGVSLVILLALAVLVARALSKPLERAAIGADRFAKGDFSYRVPVTGSAEMRRLSVSLGAMAQELDARFKTILHQREEMRVVFENMWEGVLAVDAGGRIMLVNSAAEAMLHVPAGAAGKPMESVVRNAELQDVVRETTAAKTPAEREIRAATADGGETLVQIHSATLREGETDVGVLLVLRDVTRLRQLEIMRRDFVANVSHELRTPVTAIQSCLETVLDDAGGAAGESGREFLEMALRNTRRMGAIIGNLLFLAGMENDGKAGKMADHLVRPVIDEALAMCREEAEARRVAFAVECDAELTAVMDPQLVTQALVNLIDNAVKYGPEGGSVGISVGVEGERVVIAVSDQGPGIAPKHRSRIFERFYRVGGSARIKEGSGLGLALVKHIAMAQGGDIRLESDIGMGSSFKLDLPRSSPSIQAEGV